MDVGTIHQLVRDLNFDTFGVAVTIRPESGPDIPTVGIWVTPPTFGFPGGGGRLQKKEPLKIMAIKAADVASCQRSARIIAPDGPGGPEAIFRIDGTSEIFTDHTRFKLVKETAEDT